MLWARSLPLCRERTSLLTVGASRETVWPHFLPPDQVDQHRRPELSTEGEKLLSGLSSSYRVGTHLYMRLGRMRVFWSPRANGISGRGNNPSRDREAESRDSKDSEGGR